MGFRCWSGNKNLPSRKETTSDSWKDASWSFCLPQFQCESFARVSLNFLGILDLFLHLCSYSFHHKPTRWWIFLRLCGEVKKPVGSQCGSVGVWEYCGIHRGCRLHGIHKYIQIDVLAVRFSLKCRWQDRPSAAQVAYLLVPPEWCVGSRLQAHICIYFSPFSQIKYCHELLIVSFPHLFRTFAVWMTLCLLRH